MGKPSGKHFEPRAARSCIGVTQISGTEAVGEENRRFTATGCGIRYVYSRIRSRAESDVCNLCIIGEMLQRRRVARTPNFSE